MINLTPSEERKKMLKDFYLRLVVVCFFTLGVSTLVATVAIMPSYFLSSVKKNLANTKLEEQKVEVAPKLDQSTLAAVESLEGKLNLIEKAENSHFLVSEKVIRAIMVTKMPDIKITQISYRNTADSGQKIGITGTAPSRERLLMFRQALEDSTAFKEVNLPVSNFVKGKNIQFYLSLTPA